jgi:L,D-transpeptidase catalytic domain
MSRVVCPLGNDTCLTAWGSFMNSRRQPMKIFFSLLFGACLFGLPVLAAACEQQGERGVGEEPDLRLFNYSNVSYDLSGRERSALAYEKKEGEVKSLFKAAEVNFPPGELLLRVFKDTKVLQVWAGSKKGGELKLVTRYKICAASGVPGPKRSSGDGQVPEGFYHLDYYKNHSDYFLAMRVSYPNKADKIKARGNPGSAIMIHGSCASIGCLAMSDDRIQELWVMSHSMKKAKRRVYVHIFPSEDLERMLTTLGLSKELKEFWVNLKQGFDAFEATKRLPRISIDGKGRYIFKDRK